MKAVRLAPEQGLYRLALASAYGKDGQYKEAIAPLKKAVMLDTSLVEAYYLIEEYYAELGMVDTALDYFQAERTRSPGRSAVYINIGHLYYRKNMSEEAIEAFSQAQLFDPNDPVAYCGLGVVALSQGNDEVAETLFTEAIRLDSLYAEAHLYYSLVLDRKEEHAAADREREIAYGLKPVLKEIDLSGILPLRGEKADIPFIVSTLDIIVAKLVRPEQHIAEMVKKPFDLNIGTGMTAIDDVNWLSVTSKPAMATRWVGFNLSLGFLVNRDSVRSREWDLEKVFQNVRVGHPNLPIYAGVGAVGNYTLGYGLVVRDYFNQADENNRKLGAAFTLQTADNAIGVTGMISNFNIEEVTIGRAYVGKWARYPDELLQRLELGFTFAQDNAYDYRVLGGDLLFYITSSGSFHFLVASEAAKTLEHGMGNVTGLLLQFGGMNRKDISFTLYGAGLVLGEDFEPAPFDAFYEKERLQYRQEVMDVALNKYRESSMGFYMSSGLSIASVFKMAADYQSVTGVDSSGIFTARLSVADDVKVPVILQGVFHRYNFDSFGTLFETDQNSFISAIAGIRFFKGLFSLNVLYERTYLSNEESDGTVTYSVQEKIAPYLRFGARF
jgi:Tfp pilus assembly protein PilF